MALRFGYCELDITPEADVPLEGYVHRGAMGLGNGPVLDRLLARVLTLEVDGARLCVVSLDLCLIDPELATRMREHLARAADIPVSNVLLATTHTHSGPVVNSGWGARDLPPDQRATATSLVDAYTRRLEHVVCTAARQSSQALYEGVMEYAELRYEMGYNRRLRERADGPTVMLYSLWENPARHPSGPTDDIVPIVALTRTGIEPLDRYAEPSGAYRVVLFAASSHPVVLGQDSRAVSADYPGAACRAIERWLGQGNKALFLLGPCGDTQPFLSTQQNPDAKGIVGEALGAAVVSRLAGRRRLEAGPLEARVETIPFSREHPILLQLVRIGDLRIAAVSAECFAELGVRLRRAHPGVPLLIATDANGAAGYVPTREAFESGGYEIEQAAAAGIPPDMLDKLEDRISEWLDA